MIFTGFQPNARLRSEILTNAANLHPAPVPSLEELFALRQELEDVKVRTQQRATKASDDMKILQKLYDVEREAERSREAERVAVASAKEKNRIKAKEAALNKVKREASGQSGNRIFNHYSF